MPDIARAAAASPWRDPDGLGRRLAVQREHRSAGDLPAFHPRDQLLLFDAVVAEPLLCAADQRRGVGCDVAACQAPFRYEVAAILARLRRSRIVCPDETSVRIDGHTHWNWVFQNEQVVIHVVRNSRAACAVTETMAGHRPSIWVSDLYGAQQGHADLWQVCLAHQLQRDGERMRIRLFSQSLKTENCRSTGLSRYRSPACKSPGALPDGTAAGTAPRHPARHRQPTPARSWHGSVHNLPPRWGIRLRGHVSPWLARTVTCGLPAVRMLSPAEAAIQTDLLHDACSERPLKVGSCRTARTQ